VEGQDVLDGYRAFGQDRVIEARVQVAQDPRRRELGQPAVDRVIEGHRPVLDEQHGRHSGDRLADRRDAEDGVAPDGLGIAEGLVPEGRDVHVVAPGDQRNYPGQAVFLCYMAGQGPV
jgi:hypothetical protein